MGKLLDCCCEYAKEWKLEFNASKSVSYSLQRTALSNFFLENAPIPTSNGFVYLGLPIGNDNYIENYFAEKMKKCEKALYSLRFLGCKRNALDPKSIALFISNSVNLSYTLVLSFVLSKPRF